MDEEVDAALMAAGAKIAALQAENDRLRREVESLRAVRHAEREHYQARLDSAVRILTGIHSLLYPAPMTLADGRTVVFRPKDPDPHAVLQELSDRIRAIPDGLAAIDAARKPTAPAP